MLNERIRSVRLAKNMSQVELARKLNVTKQSVSNWENDNIQPSVDMLLKIAKVLSVSCDYLLGNDERRCLYVEGLTEEQIAHLQLIINDIAKR